MRSRPSTGPPRLWHSDVFVGRRAELTACEQALSRGARLVTVVGMGGVGKTRLVNELLMRFAAQASAPNALPVGVEEIVHCELAPTRTDADVVAAVAKFRLGVVPSRVER